MCIIIVKPKGVDVPSKEVFKNSYHANSHGSGFMYQMEGGDYTKEGIRINKGYDGYKTIMKDILSIPNMKEHPLIIHFRLATSGSISKANCHPFPITGDIQELKALHITTDIGICHNGIYDAKGCTENDLSDTMVFIRDYLSQPVIRDNLKNDTILNLIQKVSKSSKLAILFGDGEIQLIGDFIEDKGLYYSNDGYKYSFSFASLYDENYTTSYATYPYNAYPCNAYKTKDYLQVSKKDHTKDYLWKDLNNPYARYFDNRINDDEGIDNECPYCGSDLSGNG